MTRLSNTTLALTAAAVILLAPLVPGVPAYLFDLFDNIGLAALVATGLVLLTGVGRLTSFGQAAFCGIGAYATGLLTTKFGWSPWATLPMALVASGLVSFVLGAFTARLSGHFLPLGTIAWGLSLALLLGSFAYTGAHSGIGAIPPLRIGTVALLQPRQIYAVIWACVLMAVGLCHNLLQSRFGRSVRLLRQSAMAAAAFGIHPARVKLFIFVFAAMLAGLSGWLFAHDQRAINPTSFGIDAGIRYLFMAVVGGGGYIWGGVAGAAFVLILKDVLEQVLPLVSANPTQIEEICFGIILVALLQVAPDGLWPLLARLRPAPAPEVPPLAPGPPPPLAAATRSGAPVEMLRLVGLGRKFGGLSAVDNVDFALRSGEIVGLIGPNGAGKSTTFNMISGALPPSSGEIWLKGQRIDRRKPQAIAGLGLARTFQHVKLVPDMSVLENVALGGHLAGTAGPLHAMARLERREEAALLAEARAQSLRVGLGGVIDKPVGTLALGQQRLVEVARALCNNPDVLLLDEPAAGLRLFEKQALAALLRDLRAEGRAILLVEHDMGFVMELTDHIIVLEFGRKIAEGAPDVIRASKDVIRAYLGAEA
ncbi:MAG: branched-chain amino acid ABC transporter ATP-binding protein/permease [Hyphomicrobiales bacterium]|nr:branched-chain amino acid ABC transporter ATP-binding protein/permease [Hyphomicrobiales bacterium]